MKDPITILYIGSSSDSISRLSESENIDLSIAENLLQAQNYMGSCQETDAILCELLVPGGDGFKMNTWLRGQTRFNAIPFILVSPKFEEHLITKSLMHLIDDFYVMPLPSIKDLTSRILFLKE